MLRVAFVALALSLGTQPLSAAQIGSYAVGNWGVGAYTDDVSGQFSNCLGTAHYKSGITLGVLVTRDINWDLWFSSADWRMQRGERISVWYRFDRSSWTGATVEAIEEQTVRMPMPSNGPIAGYFRRGRVMELSDGDQSYYFDLAGTSRLLVSLVQCVENGLAAEQVIANNSPALADEPNITNLKLEGTRVLSNFLLAADFQGAEILSEADVPEELSFAHAIAIAEGALGFAMIVPTSDYNSDAISAQIAGGFSEDCQGKFGSGSTKETVEGVRLVSSFAACQSEGASRLFEYVVVSRKPEGQYVVGIFSQGLTTSSKSNTARSPASSERLVNAAYSVSR